MNHSMATADRYTHIKIAALALIAAIVVVAVGFGARVDNPEIGAAGVESKVLVIRAGQPIQFTSRTGIEIR
jgi:hypothetical protein